MQAEEQLRERGRVAGRVFQVLDADVGQAGDFARGQRQAAGGGDVVVHDGQARGRVVDRGHQFFELVQVDGVVEGGDDHQGGRSGFGGVRREIYAFFGRQGSDPGYDGHFAGGVFDALF